MLIPMEILVLIILAVLALIAVWWLIVMPAVMLLGAVWAILVGAVAGLRPATTTRRSTSCSAP